MSILRPYDLIRNVALKKFGVHHDIVFVWRGGDSGCTIHGHSNAKDLWTRTLKETFPTMLQFGDSILLSDPKSSIQKIEIASGITTAEIPGDFLPVSYSGDNVVLSANNNGQYCTGLYDKDLRVLWQSNDYFDFYMSSGIEPLVGFPEEKNPDWQFVYLSCYEVESGKVRWSVDLSAETKFSFHNGKQQVVSVQKILGNIGGNLWIALNNQKVLIVDVNTGAIKSMLGGSFSWNSTEINNVFPSSSAMVIDPRKNVCIGLFMDDYWIVDTSTFEVTHFSLKEHFKNENVRCGGDFVFDDHNIYFSDVDHCKIAALDRNTRKVKWQHDLVTPEGTPSFAMDIQKHGDKLYVHDNQFNLHIFKNEY